MGIPYDAKKCLSDIKDCPGVDIFYHSRRWPIPWVSCPSGICSESKQLDYKDNLARILMEQR